MFFPNVLEDNNTLSKIENWMGYNHNYKIGYGQFYDMENLSSDYYPVLTPRFTRPTLARGENIRGLMYSSSTLSWLDGDMLYYGNKSYDLTPYMGEEGLSSPQQLLRFGAYLLVFPEGVYVNLYDDSDIGRMDARFLAESGIIIKYSMCDLDGEDFEHLTVSDTAPENPENGDYWLCTKPDSKGLNVWYDSKGMWQPVATTYIRVEIPGAHLTEYFNEGDTVTLNSSVVADINAGSTIQKVTDEYMVLIAVMDEVYKTEVTSDAWTLKILRKLPIMDYVTVDKNRVWGCHYGYVDGKIVNEIYASKLGDFKNWYTYTGISTDSFAVTVGIPGEFTGAITYGGYPTFFKEDAIYRVVGNMPSEYTVIESNARGVQKGSYRSLAVVGEYLCYKSPSDVVIYDGSTPTGISEALGREVRYYNAVAGGCLDKYYIKLENVAGTPYYFVYDMTYGIWEKEDALDFRFFSGSENGQMFACTDTEIIGLGITDNYLYLTPLVGEEWVNWYAVTGDLGLEYTDFKYVSRITIRAWIPHTSEITMSISYDDRPWEDIATIRGNTELTSQSFTITPYRCDHFQIKLNGHGPCRIFSLAMTYEAGSQEDNAYD